MVAVRWSFDAGLLWASSLCAVGSKSRVLVIVTVPRNSAIGCVTGSISKTNPLSAAGVSTMNRNVIMTTLKVMANAMS